MNSNNWPRIASVQHGDFASSVARFEAGGQELYGGQQYTVDTLNHFLANGPHLVVSLDAPKNYEVRKGDAEYVAFSPQIFVWIPRRLWAHVRANRIIRVLNRFKPTHLIVRCSDVIGWALLRWANRQNLPTAIIIATTFPSDDKYARLFCELANQSNVLFVANHNVVATDSLLASGLDPKKAVAWDYPTVHQPDFFPPKSLGNRTDSIRLLYAGALIPEKGVLEAIEACRLLHSAGRKVRLTVCGDGFLHKSLQEHIGKAEGWLDVVGRISTEEVHRRMRESDLVLVPTRPEFAEGLPLVIYESLVARTPLVISDHPVFKQYFPGNRAVRFFAAGDAADLARVISSVCDDPDGYYQMSLETVGVWEIIQCQNKFHDLFDRLSRYWSIPSVELDSERILMNSARSDLKPGLEGNRGERFIVKVNGEVSSLPKTTPGGSVDQLKSDTHAISPPASPGIIERLRPVLSEHGFDGPSSLLVPPKNVLDDSVKFLVTGHHGQMRGVLFWSSPNAPQASMFAANCAASAREFLKEDLGKAVLEPLASGIVDGRSYVLWPWWQPISDRRLVRTAQMIAVRGHLFKWLAAVTGATARRSETARQAFTKSLRHLAEHRRLRTEIRLLAERALTRLDTNRWEPCHILAHNDFWLGNILLEPSNPWLGATTGRFAIIDWGAGTLDGYAIYDLIRIASTVRISKQRLKREILSHCQLLGCEPEDASGYLAAALGHLGLRNDHFPADRYVELVDWCLDYLEATMK
jgi:glycosyltransferase involved in cell wall biosynthesis